MAAMKRVVILLTIGLVFCLVMERHYVKADEEEEDEDGELDEVDDEEEEEKEKQKGGEEEERNCKLDHMPTQHDFDPVDFEGMWYVISDVGMFPWQHTFDFLFYMAQDYKVYYSLQEDGNLKAYSAGRSLFRCVTSEGILTEESATYNGAKFSAQFDSWSLYGKGAFPIWIVATDYEFALLYSCRSVLKDGTCDPKQTFAWTLNRNKAGHSTEQENAIQRKAKALCLKGEFKPMPRSKPCPEIQSPDEDDDYDEKTEL